MFPRKPDQFWPLLWGGAAALLVGGLVLEHEFGRPGVGEGARPPARVADANLLPPFRLDPEPQAGTETLARPLFVPNRRPPPPAAASGEVKKGQYVLQGTSVVGSLAIAFLKDVSSGKVEAVAKGAEIGGMKVAEVLPEKVVLRSGEDSETLPLLVAKGGGNPAAAAEHGPFGPPGGGAPAVPGRPAAPAQAPGTAMPAPGAPVPAGANGRPTVGGLRGAPPAATSQSSAMTPEEIIARRRAARAAQRQN